MPTCSTLLPKPFIPLGPKMVAPFLMNNWSFNPLFPTIVQAFLFGHFTVFELKLPQTRPQGHCPIPSPQHTLPGQHVTGFWSSHRDSSCKPPAAKLSFRDECFLLPASAGGEVVHLGRWPRGWTLDSSITAASTQEWAQPSEALLSRGRRLQTRLLTVSQLSLEPMVQTAYPQVTALRNA